MSSCRNLVAAQVEGDALTQAESGSELAVAAAVAPSTSVLVAVPPDVTDSDPAGATESK